MVQIKQLKGTPNKQQGKSKQQPKKPQLQFSSSDEESDDEVDSDMGGEEAEDEDLVDEEFEDEEIEGEEFEDEEELEDEEDIEAKVPTKTQLATQVTAKGDKKSEQIQKSKTPTKVPAKPAVKLEALVKTPDASKKKTNGVAKSETKGGQKRKADESIVTKTPVKQLRLDSESSIIDEEMRRRQERNKRSLFLKGIGKIVRKPNEIKALHPDIIAVRTMGVNAWALFPTEASCEKALKQLESKNFKGKKIEIDFCGEKAKNHVENNKNIDKPINKFALLVSGLPAETKPEKLKIIFPSAKSIELPKSNKKNTTSVAFVHFTTEEEAHTAFLKHESLKVGGAPVEVLYARKHVANSRSDS